MRVFNIFYQRLVSCTNHVSLSLKRVRVSINAHVVENLADSTFIIGLDVLEAYGCVIYYRNLTFTIDGFTLPLLKAYKGNQLKYPSLLHCNRTTIIAPHSSKVLDCHMKTKSSKRLFMTRQVL